MAASMASTATPDRPTRTRIIRIGLDALRKDLLGMFTKADRDDTHFVVGKHVDDLGMIVPMSWYRTAREALGEPTDL